ncbi:hypothetical protein MRX96_050315 [Rhipicephalus microplus]
MSHSWLDSVPTDPPQHHARRPTVVRESSDTALVTGQTRSCASPQKPLSPHERVTQDYRNKVASTSCPADSATRGTGFVCEYPRVRRDEVLQLFSLCGLQVCYLIKLQRRLYL